MSKYDRFKPTALQTVQARKEEIKEANDNDNNNGRIPRKTLKTDGTYLVRIWPAHPAEPSANATSIETKRVYLVPAWVPKRDADGKPIKKADGEGYQQELRVRATYDARLHGNHAPLDLVDTYISLGKAKAEGLYPGDKEQQKKYLAPIIGNKLQNGEFQGISPITSFLFYGQLILAAGTENEKKEFYEFEVGKAIEKGIYKAAAIESGNDPLGTDGCFTDPLEGKPARIVVNSTEGRKDPANWYNVSMSNIQEKIAVNGMMKSVLKDYPISEEELDWFEADVPPLLRYRSIFDHKQLALQLEGLKIFDEKYKFGLIDTQEFKDAYNILDNLFPVTEDTAETTANLAEKSGSTGSNTDEFDLMDRDELVQFIKDNGLKIRILPRYTEQDLKDIIRETLEDGTSEEEGDEVSSQDTEESDGETPFGEAGYEDKPLAAEETTTNGTAKKWGDRLNKLKNQVNS